MGFIHSQRSLLSSPGRNSNPGMAFEPMLRFRQPGARYPGLAMDVVTRKLRGISELVL
jgi:hypothetical protein